MKNQLYKIFLNIKRIRVLTELFFYIKSLIQQNNDKMFIDKNMCYH